jgi:hypothetical protein
MTDCGKRNWSAKPAKGELNEEMVMNECQEGMKLR